MKFLIIYIFSLVSFVVHSVDLIPQKVMKITLSSTGLNRLSLKGEGVRDIFLYPGNAAEYVTLHKSGDIFISPQPKDTSFSMSIMGSKSTVQDLEVVFKDISPNPIVFKEKASNQIVNLEVLGDILVDVMRQDLMKDPALKSSLFETSIRNMGAIIIENVSGFKASFGDQTIFITKAQIQNIGNVPYVFNMEDIGDVVAISATFETLAQKASGFVYFINKKQEKSKC